MPGQNQHYVWKYYLKPWCNDKGRIHFSRNSGEVKVANLDRIMVERNFYKLLPLNKFDRKFLKQYVEGFESPLLKSHHSKLIGMFSLVANNSELFQSDDSTPFGLVVECEEILHREIERNAIPILDELRQKRKEFLACEESAVSFFLYLAHQSLRTKKIRDYMKRSFMRSHRSYDLSNVTNIFNYMTATNLGYNLYFDEDGFDVFFIESKKGPGFVTGDQPVLNLLGNRQWGDSTETLLYYPLSPYLSCLVATNEYGLKSKQVSSKLVTRLNGLIAWHSHEFIVGDSELAIQLAIKSKPFPNQSVRNILDQLKE